MIIETKIYICNSVILRRVETEIFAEFDSTAKGTVNLQKKIRQILLQGQNKEPATKPCNFMAL